MVSSNASRCRNLAPILPPRDGALRSPGASRPYHVARRVEDRLEVTVPECDPIAQCSSACLA